MAKRRGTLGGGDQYHRDWAAEDLKSARFFLRQAKAAKSCERRFTLLIAASNEVSKAVAHASSSKSARGTQRAGFRIMSTKVYNEIRAFPGRCLRGRLPDDAPLGGRRKR